MHACFLPHVDVSPPVISTFDGGTATAGQAFTLFCRVVLPEGLTTQPQIVWLSPEGDILASEAELTVALSKLLATPPG